MRRRDRAIASHARAEILSRQSQAFEIAGGDARLREGARPLSRAAPSAFGNQLAASSGLRTVASSWLDKAGLWARRARWSTEPMRR